jgi:hypothetical protein
MGPTSKKKILSKEAPAQKTPAKKPLLYADREHDDQPICLECFQRHKNMADDPTQRREWEEGRQFAISTWNSISEEKRQRLGIDGPHGWVMFILEALQWPPTKGRCWGCALQLAKSYRLLVEEIKGAPAVQAFCSDCQEASKDAALARPCSSPTPSMDT